MGKHANERAWREYDSWRTREPQDDEPLTDAQLETAAINTEDLARETVEVQGELGPRFRPARHVRLFDEI
jgi:hypothetical protein